MPQTNIKFNLFIHWLSSFNEFCCYKNSDPVLRASQEASLHNDPHFQHDSQRATGIANKSKAVQLHRFLCKNLQNKPISIPKNLLFKCFETSVL